MSKKLFNNPIIFFEFDDDEGEDTVDGSGQGGYKMSYEAWKETEWASLDGNNNGTPGEWEDYVAWWSEQGFSGDPYHQP